MDMICCSATCHTTCVFQKMPVSGNYDYTHIVFPCCNKPWSIAHTDLQLGEPEPEPEPEPESVPAIREEIKKVKKAIAAKNKGLLLAKSAIKAAHDAFKVQAAPLIASLTAMKHEAMLDAQMTEELREGTRSFRYLINIQSRFKKQFHIQNMNASWLGFGRTRDWSRWNTPLQLLKRKFYIRI
jgi:hypothetical protein